MIEIMMHNDNDDGLHNNVNEDDFDIATWSPRVLVKLNSLLHGIRCALHRACQKCVILIVIIIIIIIIIFVIITVTTIIMIILVIIITITIATCQSLIMVFLYLASKAPR